MSSILSAIGIWEMIIAQREEYPFPPRDKCPFSASVDDGYACSREWVKNHLESRNEDG